MQVKCEFYVQNLGPVNEVDMVRSCMAMTSVVMEGFWLSFVDMEVVWT